VYKSSYGSFSAGYVGRGGYTSGYTCSSGTDGVGRTFYCCSNKDDCNGAMGHTASIFAIIFLMIGSLLTKKIFFY